MIGYRGEPGAPSDPARPGPYCLAICWGGCCPQYAAQVAAVHLLREQEYAARVRVEGARSARTRRAA